MINDQVKFQPAQVADAQLLAHLRKEIREDTYRGIYPNEILDAYDIQTNAEGFLSQIKSLEQQIFLMKIEGEAIGYLGIGKPVYWYPEDADRDELFLNSLYICKPFWRRGIGKVAMQFAFQIGRSQRKQKLYNNCNLHNTNAIKFYLACGGKIIFWESGHTNRAEDQVTFQYLIT
jgi:GNAT superfamily N-acetyltransferase